MDKSRLAICSALVLAAAGANAQVMPTDQTTNSWYTEAQTAISNKLARTQATEAKNVILFVGDGLGVSTLTAARILEGQQNGNSGEEGLLSFESSYYVF